jgi:quercetin dioxygenase-like cupin family protein
MEIDRMTLGPSKRLTGQPHRPGTQEYLCCERGQLTLRVAGERFALEPGDVAAFPGDQRHSYHNEGRETAVGFSVVTLAPLNTEDGSM